MGIINSYKEENELNKQEEGTGNSETENIALQIKSYDDDLFHGIRMDTKEEVKVRMRPYEQKGDFARPEIEDFKSSKSKRHAPVNKSTLLMEGSYLEDDGVWNARWTSILSSPKYTSKVAILNANVRFIEKDENAYVEVNTLKKQINVKNIDELNEALLTAFTPTVARARGFAIIRLTESNGDSHVFQAFPKLDEAVDEDGDTIKVMASPEESLSNFENDTKRSKIVYDLINNPEIKFDIFIGARLYLGADYRKKLVDKSPFEKEGFKRDYALKEEGSKYEKALFKKTIMALRTREDGSLFITLLKPVVNNKAGVPIEQLEM